jgi:hypothetical protein
MNDSLRTYTRSYTVQAHQFTCNRLHNRHLIVTPVSPGVTRIQKHTESTQKHTQQGCNKPKRVLQAYLHYTYFYSSRGLQDCPVIYLNCRIIAFCKATQQCISMQTNATVLVAIKGMPRYALKRVSVALSE